MQTTSTIKVLGFHVDHFGHVNNARYLEFLEESRWVYCEENNLIDDFFHQKGIIHVVSKITIEYLKPCFTGQTLKIKTCVSAVDNKDIEMLQTIHDASTDNITTKAVVTNRLLDINNNMALDISEDFFQTWPDLNIKQ